MSDVIITKDAIVSQTTVNNIISIQTYLKKLQEYFKINTADDILQDIDSDVEDEALTSEQITERNRRSAAMSKFMLKFKVKALPAVKDFNPQDFDVYQPSI